MKFLNLSIACGLCLLFFTGCSRPNYFESYYGDTGISPIITDGKPDPKLIETLDIDRRVSYFIDKGFVILGESFFESEWQPRTKAIDHAKKIGAEIIVISAKYLGSEMRQYAISVPKNNTTYHSGSVYGSGGYASYSGASTTYGSETIVGSYAVGKFSQRAFFLAAGSRIKENEK